MKIASLLLISAMVSFACKNNAHNSSAAIANLDVQQFDSTKLNGAWQLRFIDGKKDSFAILFPGKNPFINFSLPEKRLNGNTGCNSFTGELETQANKISFLKPMAMTKMFCQGNGEAVFLDNLVRVRTYKIQNDTSLSFLSGDTLIMRFEKSHLR